MSVEHDEEQQRFVIRLDDGIGELRYRKPDEQTIDLVHTEVPGSLEGEGVGSALARGAFDHARDHGLAVRVSCAFVRRWLERHEEYRELVSS